MELDGTLFATRKSLLTSTATTLLLLVGLGTALLWLLWNTGSLGLTLEMEKESTSVPGIGSALSTSVSKTVTLIGSILLGISLFLPLKILSLKILLLWVLIILLPRMRLSIGDLTLCNDGLFL